MEDEYHFLLECPFYLEERDSFFQEIDFLVIDLNNSEQSFIFLLPNMENDVCSVTSKFINICIQKRNQYFIKEKKNIYSTKNDLSCQVEFLRLSHMLP